MPALINNRLAAEIDAIPAGARHAPELALAAYRVMEGAALALGLPSTGVSFFKPGAAEGARFAFVVSWPDGPTDWACSAAAHLQTAIDAPHVKVAPGAYYLALQFEGLVA